MDYWELNIENFVFIKICRDSETFKDINNQELLTAAVSLLGLLTAVA